MLATFALLYAPMLADNPHQTDETDKAGDQLKAQQYLSQRHYGFVENTGQIKDVDGNARPDVAFMTGSENAQLYFTPGGIMYTFVEQVDLDDRQSMEQRKGYRMDMKFDGANPFPTISGSGASPQTIRYYGGADSEPIATRQFERVDYSDIYDNIDVSYYGMQAGMKYDVVVKPGGDVADIQLRYEGAENITVRADGSLLVTTPLGRIEEASPYTYQLDDDGNEIEIESAFVVNDGVVGFEVGQYDPSRTLVVDPRVVWTTYFGGTGPPPPSTPGPDHNDYATSLTINSNGEIIICGWTQSQWLPTTCCYGNHQIVNNGGIDCFVACFSSSAGWVWSTYYGGTGNDVYNDVEMSNYFDRFHCVGWTNSPTLFAGANAQQGNTDVLMSWFTNDGQIISSFFYGGSANDEGNDLHVYASGAVYATGWTESSNFLNQNPAGTVPQGVYGGNRDAFVLSMNQAVTAVNWATFWGGSGSDEGHGIVMDGTHAYICGNTTAPYVPLVGSGPGAIGSLAGTCAFAAKFSSTAAGAVPWSFWFGGAGNDFATDLHLYTNNYVSPAMSQLAICGFTSSNLMLAPSFTSTTNNGGIDMFLARFTATGIELDAELHGGSGDDWANDIDHWDTTPNGFALVGHTTSTDYPQIESMQGAQGSQDVALVNFSYHNAVLLPEFSSYFGGISLDFGEGIEMLSDAGSYFTGGTFSDNLEGSDPGFVYQASHNDVTTTPGIGAFFDAFLTRTERSSKFGTFLGGSSDDQIMDMVVDGENNVIVVGWTESSNFPTSGTVTQAALAGGRDMFVSKFNSNGDILWSTYYGSVDDDEATAVDVDGNGNIFVTGFTVGDYANNFPNTSTCTTYWNLLTTYADGVLVSFDGDGNLRFARNFGGQRDDRPQDIEVWGGEIYITGFTNSIDFPVTTTGSWGTQLNVNGFYNQRYDAFVAEFPDANTCGAPTWARYYGGEDEDRGYGLAVDSNGDIVLTGWTESDNSTELFPAGSLPAFQGTIGGGRDAYIARVNNAGTVLQVSSYHGGSDDDEGRKVDTDASDRMIVLGETLSSNLPIVPGSGTGLIQAALAVGGKSDLFLATVDGSGLVLSAASYFGTSDDDFAGNLLVTPGGDVYLVAQGSPTPTGGYFAGNLQANGFGLLNSYCARTVQSLTAANTWATYYSDGVSNDGATGVGIMTDFWTNEESVAIAGFSDNSGSIYTTTASYQVSNAGNADGFIGRIERAMDELRKSGYDLPQFEPAMNLTRESLLDLVVYPQPAQDVITIEVTYSEKGPLDLQLTAVDGTTVLRDRIETYSPQVLRLGELPQGIYYLRLSNQSAATMRPIVIQR